jgi:hypothetical protein
MKSTARWAGVALAIVLSACGGGGGGSDPVASPPVAQSQTTVSGSIAPGPVAGATVQMLRVDAQGRTTLLQEVRTGSDGEYAFNATVPADSVVMLAASGGSWTDPIRKTTATLDPKLRAVDTWTGPARRINVTPYTEMVVRGIESAKTPDWSAAGVRAANTSAAQTLGVASTTDFVRLDLTQPPGANAPKVDDVTHALVNGSFVGLWHRLSTATGQAGMSTALDGLHHLVNIDPEDDRIGPALAAGTVDFLEATALPVAEKLRTQGLVLFGSDLLPTAATLAEAMPKGISSGTALAAMPDDQFRLLGEVQGRTHFNLRGALVSYGPGDAKTSRNELYTGSVAEVFADGDVGIGRWNGGVEIVTYPSGGDQFVTRSNLLSTTGRFYALARPATQIPACGVRRLGLVAHTQLNLASTTGSGAPMALTPTADSAISAMYLSGVQIAVDVGLVSPTGETVRFRSRGGLTHPELAGWQPDAENDVYLEVPVSPLFPPGTTALLKVRPAGAGARKAAAILQINAVNAGAYAALAFVGQDTPPDAQGCAQSGAPGTGIDPKPAAGSHFVFLNHNNENMNFGAPNEAVTFGPKGELASVPSPLSFTPATAYDLAGNDFASIGRVTVSSGSAAGGNFVQRSQPYAVARPDAAVPTSGSATYTLLSATAVMADRGSGEAQLPPGVIDSASVTVYFDQYPIGTPNPYYGTVRINIAGRFAGVAFGSAVNAANGYGPMDVRTSGQNLGGGNISGAFAGPTGEYLVVHYMDGVAGIPIRAALLFKRQGS